MNADAHRSISFHYGNNILRHHEPGKSPYTQVPLNFFSVWCRWWAIRYGWSPAARPKTSSPSAPMGSSSGINNVPDSKS